MDLRQAALVRFGRGGFDHPAVKRSHVTAFDPDHAETEIGRSGIYAHYDSHCPYILDRASDAFRASAGDSLQDLVRDVEVCVDFVDVVLLLDRIEHAHQSAGFILGDLDRALRLNRQAG